MSGGDIWLNLALFSYVREIRITLCLLLLRNMAELKFPDEVLDFTNHIRIEIYYCNSTSYYRCNTYDEKLMSQGFVWHQIVVDHNERIPVIERKKKIIEGIFVAVEGEEFYPVAYRSGRKEDRFLVRQCRPALDKLFAQNLRVVLSSGVSVFLQVQLNVAEYKIGQISSIIQITKALNNLYERMEHMNGEGGILNLSRFSRNRELFDVIVNLGCRGVLARLFDLIYRNDEKFRLINGLILSDNDISTMSPFKLFEGVEFAVLDLQNNNLQSYKYLCCDLESIKADELKLIGNPITKSPKYPACLRPILKNFKLLDGIPTENLSEGYRPPVKTSSSEREGYRIDWSNKEDINQFEKSADWHAFMIRDADHKFSKVQIIDYFFFTISPDHSEIYPCYYKYTNGEHQFLVRQCFDQIKYLVERCNLEIKISPTTEMTNDNSSQPNVDTTLVFYLLMNLSHFSKGQVEPSVCFEKALNIRFSAMDSTLNLDDFQSAEGLENIAFTLNPPKILTRILTLVSRKFLTACEVFRLAHNKINILNYPKILQKMTRLKVIDLGNNWIHDLDDIRKLSLLKIQCLRLDGNPLCSKYSSAKEYITAVTKLFPELIKLDGIYITDRDCLSFHQNYICNVAAHDFVDEFITHYFKTYETKRKHLKDIYSSKAMVTITCSYDLARVTPKIIQRISKYTESDHNLTRGKNLQEIFSCTYVGPKHIQRLLLDLPKVTFDMLSFCTDCPIYTNTLIVVVVSGVFLDQAPTLFETDILMYFMRTFVLKRIEQKAGPLKCASLYKIINDNISVYNPTTAQMKMTFKYFKSNSKKTHELTVEDKEAMLVMLQKVTGLTTMWCTKYLEDADWNFQKTLEIFHALSEKKAVPAVAFN